MSHDEEEFRVTESGYTEIKRKGQWQHAFNFTIRITRFVTGGPDKGGMTVEVTSALQPNRNCQGYLSERDIYKPSKLHPAIKGGTPGLPCACIQLTSNELRRFWAMAYEKHRRTSIQKYGNDRSSVASVNRLGKQSDGTFVLGENEQLDSKGNRLKKDETKFLAMKSHLLGVPMCNIPDQFDNNCIPALYRQLERDLPDDTFMAASLMGGTVLAALHYQQVKAAFHQVPVPVLVGKIYTNKTFLSKVTMSMLGLGCNALFLDLNKAWSVKLLGKGIFFVFDNPTHADLLKTLITKAHGDGSTSHVKTDSIVNTIPLITTYPSVIRQLLGHGTRETNRCAMIPLVEQATCNNGVTNDLMKNAAGGVDKLVALGQYIKNLGPRVDHFRERMITQLPVGDTSHRIAYNYAILFSLTEMFITAFQLNISEERLQTYIFNTLIPKGVLAYQLPTDCGDVS